ncbi:S-adenosylmethionine:tRNA ribosyltransferase-isomerase [Breznakibacter xylanolyticus]|uniref:S-adenosylmethionine:tRNA ribosyltransferase-isomerase n=1 Tax=Breznakibacter xylanolyticus TaxID=990 RepID=A0A2W7N877_9BACT|nr:S-adenosylmethionine:tRNA ribosyltransferase-isomerase [Breznakibacter xylanolyticus]PZX14407.1 S-adenosylmethionine:tRNA ribosyltransferase-isomerase [Breznakibacter xylanolyticus]
MIPSLSIDSFNYHLPDDKIAKYPLAERDNSKLLVYRNNTIHESCFKSITDHLPPHTQMVFNNTKVIRARMEFTKQTGARVEIFCLEPTAHTEMQTVFAATQKTQWNCIVGNLKKWKTGALHKELVINGQPITLTANKLQSLADSHVIEFSWNGDVTFSEVLDAAGNTPIPPYLNRQSESIDTQRYQTVYSEHQGSVAAPTAGLHFTPMIIQQMHDKGISTRFVTLHVGAGTFKPVKSPTIDGHEMHVELFTVDRGTLAGLTQHQGPRIAVGTTSVRTLESLYWIGVKLSQGDHSLVVNQWDAYQLKAHLSYSEAIQQIVDHLDARQANHLTAHTGIMIAPGYQFKSIDGMVTNFHQPQSTLLLLLSAFVGDAWRDIYNYALTHDFRFLSYGDSSLLLKPGH